MKAITFDPYYDNFFQGGLRVTMHLVIELHGVNKVLYIKLVLAYKTAIEKG